MSTRPADQTSPETARDAKFEAGVREGLADAEAGRVTSYEKVRRWLLSWGSDRELPPPECP